MCPAPPLGHIALTGQRVHSLLGHVPLGQFLLAVFAEHWTSELAIQAPEDAVWTSPWSRATLGELTAGLLRYSGTPEMNHGVRAAAHHTGICLLQQISNIIQNNMQGLVKDVSSTTTRDGGERGERSDVDLLLK